MFGAFTAGLLIGLSAAVLAATAAMLVMEAAAHRNVRTALGGGAGVATGDAVWAAVVAGAGTALNRLMTPLASVLHWVAVAVIAGLLVLAVRDLVRSDTSATTEPDLPMSPSQSYRDFFAGTLVDPVTVVFFLSVIVGVAPSYRPAEAAVFVVGAFLASLSWQCGLTVVGRRRGVFTPRARRIVLLVDVVLLVVFAGYIAAGLYRP